MPKTSFPSLSGSRGTEIRTAGVQIRANRSRMSCLFVLCIWASSTWPKRRYLVRVLWQMRCILKKTSPGLGFNLRERGVGMIFCQCNFNISIENNTSRGNLMLLPLLNWTCFASDGLGAKRYPWSVCVSKTKQIAWQSLMKHLKRRNLCMASRFKFWQILDL